MQRVRICTRHEHAAHLHQRRCQRLPLQGWQRGQRSKQLQRTQQRGRGGGGGGGGGGGRGGVGRGAQRGCERGEETRGGGGGQARRGSCDETEQAHVQRACSLACAQPSGRVVYQQDLRSTRCYL